MRINVQPDGTQRYQIDRIDQWQNITNISSTYTANGVVAVRTNQYVYSASSATSAGDLLMVVRPDGITNVSYVYNTNHNVLFMTNAVGYVASYTYNTNQQLTSVSSFTGLITTNIYNSSNRLATTYSFTSGGQYFGTNSYSYTNDLVYTHTDERGLTTTNSWDNLRRLTNIAYPDGTHMSYIYSKLDLVEVIDRLGFSNVYTYDAIERRTSATDANGHKTSYGYCNCGAIDDITNALGQVTQFEYDNQGNRVTEIYADGYNVFNTFNSIRQLTVRKDGAGMSISNFFNNQGLLTGVSNAAGPVLSRTYDIDDRVTNSVDKNGVVVTMTYDNLNRTVTRTYPDGGVEGFDYSPFGLIAYTNQLSKITYYTYNAEAWKTSETNALTNVTQYGYSPAGDLTSLTDQNGHTTQWGYDQYGRVTNKVDATTNTILKYQYDANNRLTNRWSLAKSNTVYGYDSVGNLTGVSYAQAVAPTNKPLAFSYDNINELVSMADGIGTTTFSYTSGQQLASETGPWTSDAVAYTYSDRLRSVLNLQQPNASAWVQNYGYDSANRLNSIGSPAGTFSYTYNPGLGGASAASALISKLTLPNGAWITNTFDNDGRMLGTYLYNSSAATLDSSVYTYNVGNQRTTLARNGENTASYTYDGIGEVVGDVAVEGTTSRMNEQLHYGFDPAGNLQYRTNNTLLENFQVNTLNELTQNTNGGKLTVMGTVTSQNSDSVTVNGTAGQVYGDATFAVTNLSLVSTYTAIASDSYGRHSTNTVNVNLFTNNAAYQYDGNGNLTNDGVRNFAYDNENQLIQVWVPNQWFSQFSYDGKMRRRIRQEYTWQSGTWVQTNAVYYVYDGNTVIQERNINNLPTTTYTRGQDLSGSLEGAGGIGGLLSMTLNIVLGLASSNSSYYHSDGNGNVTMLINPSQAIVAKYLYDAFGNVLSASGSLAQQNLYRFSSKEAQANSGLVYYLYRYYDPHLQRWPNRDPFGELGFEAERSLSSYSLFGLLHRPNEFFNNRSLYIFLHNSSVLDFDPNGLCDSQACKRDLIDLALLTATAAVTCGEGSLNACKLAVAAAAVAAGYASVDCQGCIPPDHTPQPPNNGNCPVNNVPVLPPMQGPPILYFPNK